MKMILLLSLLGFHWSAMAYNKQAFAGKNFDVLGDHMCALHLEFSGSNVIASNVVPTYIHPSQVAYACSEKGYWQDCTGLSFTLKCENDGVCQDKENPGNSVQLMLLDDGNIAIRYSPTSNAVRKYIKSNVKKYYTCQEY